MAFLVGFERVWLVGGLEEDVVVEVGVAAEADVEAVFLRLLGD